MSLLHAVVLAEAEAHLELFFPAWVFPLIAALIFTALGFIIFSFRDVANRHSHKTGGSAASGHTTDH
jgi:uncharacterized integral membrane protein